MPGHGSRTRVSAADPPRGRWLQGIVLALDQLLSKGVLAMSLDEVVELAHDGIVLVRVDNALAHQLR